MKKQQNKDSEFGDMIFGTILGAILFSLVTFSVCQSYYRYAAIEAGAAYYDTTNGNFTWKTK